MQFFQKFLDNFLDSGDFGLFLNKKLVCKMTNIFVVNIEILDTFYKNFRQFWAKIYTLRY